MKWEILKGSDKDFEGAPEWATLQTTTCGQRFFVEKHAASARLMDIYNREESTIEANPMPNQFDDIEIIAERRPIADPDVNQQVTTEWDGEGLPPVGVECEIRYRNAANAEWVAFRCVGVDCGVAFGWSGKLPVAIDKSEYNFRPIRSPEDGARDDATKEMNEVWREHAGKERNGNLFSIYEIIYDAIAAGKIPGVKLE